MAAGNPIDPLARGVGFVNWEHRDVDPDVAVLVFGAAVLGDLIDDGSLVYLWLRPVPSWVHVLARWAATVTVVVPLVLVPVVVATAIIDTSPQLVEAAALGGLVAVMGYGSCS